MKVAMHAEAKRSEAAAGTHLPNPQLEGPALCSAPSANMFYQRTGHRAQSKWYSVRWMHILANQYAELPSKCGGVTTGTVAHVRTLDMNPSQAVHPAYGQPPLSFYLSAWNHTGDNTLHVVHKDLSSPVAKTLDVLRRSTNMPIKMHSHDRFKDLVPTLQHDPRPPTVYSLVGGRGSELYLKGNRTQLKTQTNATVCLAQYEQSKEVRDVATDRLFIYECVLLFWFSASPFLLVLFASFWVLLVTDLLDRVSPLSSSSSSTAFFLLSGRCRRCCSRSSRSSRSSAGGCRSRCSCRSRRCNRRLCR